MHVRALGRTSCGGGGIDGAAVTAHGTNNNGTLGRRRAGSYQGAHEVPIRFPEVTSKIS